jgi:hypothetical protein
MFGKRIDVPALGNINKQDTAVLENADVLPQKRFSLRMSEMLEKALVKNDIEGFVWKWKLKGVASDNCCRKVQIIGQPLEDPERILGVVKLNDVCPVFDEGKTIPPGASPYFKDLFSAQIALSEQVPENPVLVRIDLSDILLLLPKRLPVLAS